MVMQEFTGLSEAELEAHKDAFHDLLESIERTLPGWKARLMDRLGNGFSHRAMLHRVAAHMVKNLRRGGEALAQREGHSIPQFSGEAFSLLKSIEELHLPLFLPVRTQEWDAAAAKVKKEVGLWHHFYESDFHGSDFATFLEGAVIFAGATAAEAPPVGMGLPMYAALCAKSRMLLLSPSLDRGTSLAEARSMSLLPLDESAGFAQACLQELTHQHLRLACAEAVVVMDECPRRGY